MKYSEKIPDEVDKKILSLLAHGYTYQQISREIYKSSESVKKRLQVLKEYYSCKTNAQLMAYCTENSLY